MPNEFSALIDQVLANARAPGQSGVRPDITARRPLTGPEDLIEGLKSGVSLGFAGSPEGGYGTAGSIIGEMLPFLIGAGVASIPFKAAARVATASKLANRPVRGLGRLAQHRKTSAFIEGGPVGTAPLEALRELNVEGRIDPLTLGLTTLFGGGVYAFSKDIGRGLKAVSRRLGISSKAIPEEQAAKAVDDAVPLVDDAVPPRSTEQPVGDRGAATPIKAGEYPLPEGTPYPVVDDVVPPIKAGEYPPFYPIPEGAPVPARPTIAPTVREGRASPFPEGTPIGPTRPTAAPVGPTIARATTFPSAPSGVQSFPRGRPSISELSPVTKPKPGGTTASKTGDDLANAVQSTPEAPGRAAPTEADEVAAVNFSEGEPAAVSLEPDVRIEEPDIVAGADQVIDDILEEVQPSGTKDRGGKSPAGAPARKAKKAPKKRKGISQIEIDEWDKEVAMRQQRAADAVEELEALATKGPEMDNVRGFKLAVEEEAVHQQLKYLRKLQLKANQYGNTDLADAASALSQELLPSNLTKGTAGKGITEQSIREHIAAGTKVLNAREAILNGYRQAVRAALKSGVKDSDTSAIKVLDDTITAELAKINVAKSEQNGTILSITNRGAEADGLYHISPEEIILLEARAETAVTLEGLEGQINDLASIQQRTRTEKVLQKSEAEVEADVAALGDGVKINAVVVDTTAEGKSPVGKRKAKAAAKAIDDEAERSGTAGVKRVKEKTERQLIRSEIKKLEKSLREGVSEEEHWAIKDKIALLEAKSVSIRASAKGRRCSSACLDYHAEDNLDPPRAGGERGTGKKDQSMVFTQAEMESPFSTTKGMVSKRMGIFSRFLPGRIAWGSEFGAEVIDHLQKALNRMGIATRKYYKSMNEVIKSTGWKNTKEANNTLYALLHKHIGINGEIVGDVSSFRPVDVAMARGTRKILNEAGVEFGVGVDRFLKSYIPRLRASVTETLDDMGLKGAQRAKVQGVAETDFSMSVVDTAFLPDGTVVPDELIESIKLRAKKEGVPYRQFLDKAGISTRTVRELQYLGAAKNAGDPDVLLAKEVRQRASDRFGTDLNENFSDKERVFFAEMHRNNTETFNPSHDGIALIAAYIRQGAQNTHFEAGLSKVRPHIDFFFRDDPLQGAQFDRFLQTLRGAPTPQEVLLNRTIHKIAAIVGMKSLMHPRISQDIASMLTSLAYSGGLGAKVGGALKNLTQSSLTFAELGAKYLLKGIWDSINDPASRALLKEVNIHTAPYETILGAETNFGGLVNKVSKMARASLKMFVMADKMNRSFAFLGARSKFLDYHAAGRLQTRGLRGLNIREAMKGPLEEVLKSEGAEAAARRYAEDIVANTQYLYGAANSPQFIQSGPAGKLAGIFMTWPLNYGGLWSDWIKNKNYTAAMRMVFAQMAMVSTAAKFADVDVTNWFMLAAMPGDLPLFTFPLKTAKMATLGSKTLMHKIFFGASDPDQAEFMRRAMGDWRNSFDLMIPGSSAYKSLMRGIDESGFSPEGIVRGVSGLQKGPPR